MTSDTTASATGSPALTTLFLVRHGETPGNRLRRFQTYDTPLSDTGREQAARVAERLAAELPLHALYASDLARTMETARHIGDRTGLDPVPMSAFRELDTGDWKGHLYAEIEEQHPGALQGWIADGGVERLSGGESATDVYRRVSAAFGEIVARHAGERVVIVSHGWALSMLLAHVHEWDHVDAFRTQRVRLDNTAVSVVEVDTAGARRCVLLNCTAHLESPASADGRPVVA